MDITWADVDPASHPFDSALLQRVLSEVVDTHNTHTTTTALTEVFGVWVFGWDWGAVDGGPVQSWCCASHSFTDDSVNAVTAAVLEWRSILVELADWFPRLAQAPSYERSDSVEDVVERATALLVEWAVERTNTEDAWYGTFDMIAQWFIESQFGLSNAEGLVQRTVSGRFQSWCEPAESVAADVCAELGLAVADEILPKETRDGLAQWRKVRSDPSWDTTGWGNPQVSVRDGHLDYINSVDRIRDPERADAMVAALRHCRRAASKGAVLDFAMLAKWQQVVLRMEQVDFRVTDAFAKGGRERYGFESNVEEQFLACLADANNNDVDPLNRAARVYFDVCFFHPFEDGNARAARLAMDFVLTRAGLTLLAAEPLFLLPRSPFDVSGLWSSRRLLQRLAAHNSRS